MKTRSAALIVGLGNPGSAYASHRHNVGFWVINRLARRWGIELKAGRLASVGQGAVEGKPAVLAKPRTFVNRSGQAVAHLLYRYSFAAHAARARGPSLPIQSLLVVCDDLDLPVGTVRIRPHGGHGGHNGLRSIVAALGSQEFPRIRVGIGRPLVGGLPTTDPEVIAHYVLSQPPPQERTLLEEAVGQAADAVAAILAEGIETAMSRYNRP